jgi:hypothetical protein
MGGDSGNIPYIQPEHEPSIESKGDTTQQRRSFGWIVFLVVILASFASALHQCGKKPVEPAANYVRMPHNGVMHL